MHSLEEFVTVPDGTPIFLRRSLLNSPRRLLILHGLFEHSVNYPSLMERIFPEPEVSWAALDFRGHGRSGGEPNEVDAEIYASDIQAVLAHLGWEPGSFAGLGHSFGALMALYLSKVDPRYFRALVLASPFLGMPDSRSPLEQTLLKTLSYPLPGLKIRNPIEAEFLTHDKVRVHQYVADPLIRLSISLRSLRNILTMQRTARDLRELPIPVLLFAGTDERVVSRKAIQTWTDNYQGERLAKMIVEGYYHEVFNELGNEPLIRETREFLRSTL